MNMLTTLALAQARSQGFTAARVRAGAEALDTFVLAIDTIVPKGDVTLDRAELVGWVQHTAMEYRTVAAVLAEDERTALPSQQRVDAIVACLRVAGNEPGERAAALGRLEVLGCTSTELRAALAVLA